MLADLTRFPKIVQCQLRHTWLGATATWTVAARLFALVLLAGCWCTWIVQLAFPFGGGESHWVMMHIRPLRLRDGLFLGGLYVAASLCLLVMLMTRRVWLVGALSLGVAVASMVASEVVVGGMVSPVFGFTAAMPAILAFASAPLVVVGLLAMAGRGSLSWRAICAIASWPAALHLPNYVLESGLPVPFRLGVGAMWLTGGLLVWVLRDVSARGTQRVQ